MGSVDIPLAPYIGKPLQKVLLELADEKGVPAGSISVEIEIKGQTIYFK
jgi:hypothetical protein